MDQPDPHNEKSFKEIRVQSTLQEAKLPEKAILEDVEKHGFGPETIFAIKLALEEAMTNAVKHGNANDPDKFVHVRFAVSSECAVIIVRDDGPGFNPADVPDPTAPERLSQPSGRGIMLMGAYMDEVKYRDKGREVYMLKKNGD